MSLRRSLGMRGPPTGRDFQRQRRRNPWRCQRTKVSGRTFTRASRHANRRPRITIISRVESSARCGFTYRSRNRASGLRRKRFSLASARRDLETSTRRRTRSHATEDNVLRLCVSGWKTAPRMNDQLYTLLDVTRLPIGGWAKFLRTTAHGWLIVNGEGSTDSLQIVGKQELGRTSTKTSAPASQLRVIRTERGTPLPRKETVCRVSLRMAGNRNFRAQSRELTEFIIEEFLCGMTPERWKQIEELYHAAQARGRDVLAGVDSELRAKVEALLAQDSAGKILDDPAAELLPDSTLTMLMPGSQLGPYRIESKLGAGGMGEVVRATDTRLHRTVAIKTLQHDKHQDKRRFLQEARAASELNHPNIVVLYDIAKDNGTDYLVMEYVRGKSLDKLIPARGLALDEVIRYAEQIASALVAAHAAGIVHRDIKPTNIMVTETGQVKVLDFGLAKLDERVPDEETRSGTLTEAGVIMGTLAFMSPEQARGEKVDARTDLF